MKNFTSKYKHHFFVLTFIFLINFGFSQATLPVSRTTWNAGAPTGWTDSGTGSYTSSYACSTNNGGRLDSTADYYQVYFNSTPDQLSYTIKISGTTTSSLLVEESPDGVSWTTIVNHITIPTACSTYNYTLAGSTRYVRWTYTKVTQNLTIDDVSITSSGCTPTHTITSFTPTSGPIGTTVTITGTGFTASSTVDFNGTAAAVTFVNSTTLTATVPTGATTGVITVTETGCPVDSATNFTITACSPTHTITNFAPTSGPELTEVTITGTGFTAGTTVSFNGTTATIISQTTTQIIAEVPTGTTTGVITVTEAGCPLDSATDFTIIDNNGCTGGGAPTGFTDLMFSGIYDETSGSCHYIELFNPTASAINLSAYSIGSSNNQTLPNTLPATYNGGTYPLSGTIQPYSTFLILATSDATNCASCTNVTLDLQFLNSALGYNGYTTANYDKLVLLNGATAIDLWSNGNGYDDGYIYSRLSTATAPALLFNSADWSGNTTPDCFSFAISSTPLPTVNTQPSDVTSCSANTFSITASPGNSGALTYQWKYNDGSTTGWTDVTGTAFTPGIVTGETSNTLTINGFNLEGYQFYCQVTEDATCAVASNSAQYKVPTYTWDGTVWSSSITPTITENAVIDGDYDTATFGSFSACQIFINSGNILTVDNSTYVEIENDATIYGDILVETHGAFVQNNDLSNFILDASGTASVNKSTTVLNNWYDYTYWSSPIVDETVGTGLDIAPANRRFWFNANNYLDVFAETNNNDAAVAGHDDIDDDKNDWQIAAAGDTMTPGIGYAATVSPTGFVSGNYQVNFMGEFNNGVITTPIAYNGANGDFDWNFIGNPYPCAIDSNVFFTANSGVISGAAYLWSHNTPPSNTSNGNEGQNFAQADYAIITQSGVNTAGGDPTVPNNYIPSGQGFFVQGLTNGNVTFNNSMRMADTSSNNQFFRTTNTQEKNVVWINLTSDNGVFNQIAIAYVNGATNGNDGFAFDATRNLASGNAAIIYSTIEGEDRMFAIQGKNPSSLNNDEIVPIGLKTNIDIPTVYSFSIAQIEGTKMDHANIYIKDNLLETEHLLSESDYTFSSEVGEFNNRFEIRFKSIENSTENELLVVKSENENLSFSTTNQSVISKVYLFDLLGRLLYNVEYGNETTLANLKSSALPTAVMIAKVTLADGKVLTKKLIKQ